MSDWSSINVISKFRVWLFFTGAIWIGLESFVVLRGADSAPSDYFTLGIIPDTQIYTKNDPDWRRSSRKEIFYQMTDWLATHADVENIRFVFHMGDIVTQYNDPSQWAVANQAMSRLDGVVPYCFTLGNHDISMDGMQNRDSTFFNLAFPYTRYERLPWYGGRLSDDGFTPDDNYDNSVKVLSYSPWNPENPSLQFKTYPFDLPGYNKDPFHEYDFKLSLPILKN
jgi:hypothetical protein